VKNGEKTPENAVWGRFGPKIAIFGPKPAFHAFRVTSFGFSARFNHG